ncbi:MAG: DUF2007 domain-containing protein [Muribaculaceae bacterium]|nr:DUF2007 domain-containing protein [Muribaculaceae bacterium]
MDTKSSSIRLAAFDTLDSAYIAMGMLESNGIECSLLNGIISSVYPLDWASPVVVVKSDQAEQARRLMTEGGMEKYLI